MSDVLTKTQRSYNMSRILSKNTNPEITLKNILKKNKINGFRFHSKLQGNPDFVFRKQKLAVFVDGCFWHKCPKCFIQPETRKSFWLNKIDKNVKRDKKVNKELRKKDWKVLRIWEHQIKHNEISVKTKILNALAS